VGRVIFHFGKEVQCIRLSIKSGIVFKVLCKHKDKAIPLQSWTGLEGSRRLRLPDFKNT
jgi:hypothetical protein